MINQKEKYTVSFYTLGCRLNQSETASIQNSFDTEAYDVVRFNQPADIVVINTCTVTENGDADTRRLVKRAVRLNPKSRIALIGCQAQVQKKRLLALPNVHWVVGNAKKFDLVSILKEDFLPSTPRVITPTIPRTSFTIPFAGVDKTHTRANLKIQDGCDFFCSFCEIPYARGRARSRQFSDIIREAKILVDAGHREIILTGINIGTFKNSGKSIIDVIDSLERMEGLARIRISSIEPTTIPMKLIQKMAKGQKLCRYLHIPLQSGSNKILKNMQRKYTRDDFLQFINTCYKKIDDICIGTDVIVGFPGETEDDFNTTIATLKDSPVHYFHVFSYSPRYMAKSNRHNDTLPIEIIQKRSKTLRDLSVRKRRVFFETMLGKTMPVLFEQLKGEYWVGLTDNYIRVNVKSGNDLHNKLCDVKLTKVNDQSVTGRLV